MSLETRDLAIGYDSSIITGITMKVEPGRIVALIGPNGSGKSTLLKTVTGALRERGGVVELDGADRSSLSANEVAKRLSMVMTVPVRPELMTCREVTESGRYPYTGMFGRLSAADREKVDEAIAVTETGDIADRPFTGISDGQRQRVMLARAIAQEPEVLVLDEPTSFLDIRYKIDILTKISDLAKSRNIAVLMSVHEPEIAMNLADTVVAVGDGRVQRIGTPREVFEEGFIRSLYGLSDMSTWLLGADPFFPAKPVSNSSASFAPCVIMIQGTMSNVGKSMIAAGLCRVFAQDGYRVAPFKSQNMALNSFVTDEGLEMGRAQVMQAECAGCAPAVAMNPVLLKPVSDCGSQVIVNGRVVGNMKAAEYYEYKKSLVPVIKEAFETLRAQYDIIVVEGAGSPAEINLKDGDIVNMGLAEMINAPVLLAGDIDRGGVFAQLLGTLDLLEDDERARVKGLIVNKFRGDKALLEPGLDMIEEKSGIPVTGVIPFADLHLDDEDSLSDRFGARSAKTFDIAVIRLPHISNFTDFDVFEQSDDVSVRYISDPLEMGDPDILILPGTKNTIGDMKWLKESGFARAVGIFAEGGGVVIGICGGYQMLGRRISDPDGTEGGGDITGLELLPVDTVLKDAKTRRIFDGAISSPSGVLEPLKGANVRGYEIHMGVTEPYAELSEFTSEGTGYCCRNVYGSYVHGLFDKKDVAGGVIGLVAKHRGKSVDTGCIADQADHKERQYDRLADLLRKNLDINAIYKIMSVNRQK